MKAFLHLLVAITWLTETKCFDLFINPQLLTDKVKELLEDSLKSNELQKHFNSLPYTKQQLGEKEINEIIELIGRKIKDHVQVIKRLQEAAEKTYLATGRPESKKCCMMTNLTQDRIFQTQTNRETSCTIASLNHSNSLVLPEEPFTSVAKTHLNTYLSSKWQGFGLEHGFSIVYPSIGISCSFAITRPISRPWFFNGYVPNRNMLVVVVDVSSSTARQVNGETILSRIKQTLENILSSLSTDDKIAVIAFSNTAKVVGRYAADSECFADTFILATENNKRTITTELNKLKSSGDKRFYGDALSKAFGFFHINGSASDEEVNKVIVFASTGEPDDENLTAISEIVETENLKLNNSVMIFSYGIGDANFSVLKNLTSNILNTNQISRYFEITNMDELIFEMSLYYKHIPETNFTEPVWSKPYLDRLGLGQLMTASLPVIANNTRIGVVSLDVVLDDLMAGSLSFRPNDFSYSFVIDNSGLILSHPAYPSGVKTESIYVDATQLEQDDEFLSVFESMKRGEEGNKTFISTHFIKADSSPSNAAIKVKKLSTYIWKKIPQTQFSVCIVLGTNDSYANLSTHASLPPNTFLHNRLDLVPPNDPCVHQLPKVTFGSKTKTSVFLSIHAFNDPEDHIYHNYTVDDILGIGKYMEGSGPNHFNIKEEVKQEVVATAKAEELWVTEENLDLRKHVAGRFIGTKGVFRIYPATQVPESFEPAERSWYIDAVTHKDSSLITLPYLLSGSDMHIITLSKAIFRNGKDSQNQKDVVAVIGVDIFVHYFRGVVLGLYSNLINSPDFKFYLMDSSGYFIVTDDFTTSKEIKHITDLEPQIASILLLTAIMKRLTCSRFEVGRIQRQYQIVFPPNQNEFRSVLKQANGKCQAFSLAVVPETSALTLIRTIIDVGCETFFQGHADTCACPDESTENCKQSWTVKNECECPCTDTNPSFFPCSSTYDVKKNSFPCLSPQPLNPFTYNLDGDFLNDLPVCYEISLGMESENSFSTIILSTSLSAFAVFFVLGTLITIYFAKYQRKEEKLSDGNSDPFENTQTKASNGKTNKIYPQENNIETDQQEA